MESRLKHAEMEPMQGFLDGVRVAEEIATDEADSID
jgi:hypothetical protein